MPIALIAPLSHLLLFAVRTELFEIGSEFAGLLFILDAVKDHLSVRNLGARVFDVVLERGFVPANAGILVGVGVVEVGNCPGMASIEPVQYGTNLVLGVFTDGMTGKTLLEGLFAGGHILCLRNLN